MPGRLYPDPDDSSGGSSSGGLGAALALFKHACAAVQPSVRQASPHHEGLAVRFSRLVVSELEAAAEAGAGWAQLVAGGAAGGGCTPARARVVLLQVTGAFPPARLLLRLGLGL